MPRHKNNTKRSNTVRFEQLPYRQHKNPYQPIKVLSDDAIEAIHNGSMRILEEIGLEIINPRTKELMLQHGAEIDQRSGYVKMDRNLVMEKIATTPSEFKLYGRTDKFTSVYGHNNINFGIVSSAPNCSDIDNGRRTGNFDDFCKFLKLGQIFNMVGVYSGYPVEPIDLPAHTRHLDAYQAFITLTEKPWGAYSLGNGKIEDAINMACIARGIDKEQLKKEPSVMTVINTNSPLKVDLPMLDGLTTMAEHGQPVIVTPFTLSGAMSPVTLAGALSQQNAEALAILAVVQMINPGAPSMYGGFTSNVDMRSGAPAFGTPEYAKAVLAGGQLARHYDIPYRTSNVNAANCVDAQAAWESEMSLWSAIMSYGNLIKHSGGWLEGGLCASFEKLIVDMEMMQMMSEFLQPLTINEDELAFDAIKEVGAGGHFFGTQHTIDRYKDAFYSPIVSDWRNFETWHEAGSVDTAKRANKLYKQLLNDFQEPELDIGIKEQLAEYVAKRKLEIQPDW